MLIQHVRTFIHDLFGGDKAMLAILQELEAKAMSGVNEGDSSSFLERNGLSVDAIDAYVAFGKLPEPELRGLVWNLHGFTNVISSKDTENLKFKGGDYHETRQGLVQDIAGRIGGLKTGKIKEHEADIRDALGGDIEEADDFLDIPISDAQRKKIITFCPKAEQHFEELAKAKKSDPSKFRLDPDAKDAVLAALRRQQAALSDDPDKAQEIDKLLDHLQADKVLRRFRQRPNYLSDLLRSFATTTIPGPDDSALIPLIDKVKELRAIVKALSVFQTDLDEISDLHASFEALSKVLYRLINRNANPSYESDDQNLAVYLDKELNKYGIVSYITSLLNEDRLALDFMLLNEMNRGIQAFTREVEGATGNKYRVESGPEMAAMTQSDTPSQREYYPLVYDSEKFTHVGVFLVGLRNGTVVVGKPGADVPWMKPENKKKGNTTHQSYLDYRPLVVHRLTRNRTGASTGGGPKKGEPEIWLAAVHTTPYGTEFSRKKIYEELEAPLQHLRDMAAEDRATLIIGGDFYVAAEAFVDTPASSTSMYHLTTEKEREEGNKYPFTEDSGSIEEIRNLRDWQRRGYNFTKRLAGDENPIRGKGKTRGMELKDVRSITGTNKNSAGLQSADYFVVPIEYEDRVVVGLIDPKSRTIVELETEDQEISRHDLRFSDHVISAIELYGSRQNKEAARTGRRLRDARTKAMYEETREAAIEKDRRAAAFGIGDYEPRPGISSLVTTLLQQIYVLVQERQERSMKPVEKADLALPEAIQTVRLSIKKTAYDPDEHQSDLEALLDALQRINDEAVQDLVGVVGRLISNYLEPGTSSPPENEHGPREGYFKKWTWGVGEYPRFDELPAFLRAAFGETLQIVATADARDDAEALAVVLDGYGESSLAALVEDLRTNPNGLRDPGIEEQLNALGLAAHFYSVGFFVEGRGESEQDVMAQTSKYTYGRGETAIRILDIGSSRLKPLFTHSGFHLMQGDQDIRKVVASSSKTDRPIDRGPGRSDRDVVVADDTASNEPLLAELLGDRKKGGDLGFDAERADASYRERLALQLRSARHALDEKPNLELAGLAERVKTASEDVPLGTDDYLVAIFYLQRQGRDDEAKTLGQRLIQVIERARFFETWEVEVEQAQAVWAALHGPDRGLHWQAERKERTRLANRWMSKYGRHVDALDSAQKKRVVDALNAEENAEKEAEAIRDVRSLFRDGNELTDGNCLFAALTWNNDEVGLAAANRVRQGIVGHLHRAAVEQTPFAELRPSDGNLHATMLYEQMRGGVTLELYRRYMSIPGVWAGDPEILAWSSAHPGLTVYVLEPGSSTFRTFLNGTERPVTRGLDAIVGVRADKAIALSSSGRHYRRLLPAPVQQFRPSAEALQLIRPYPKSDKALDPSARARMIEHVTLAKKIRGDRSDS